MRTFPLFSRDFYLSPWSGVATLIDFNGDPPEVMASCPSIPPVSSLKKTDSPASLSLALHIREAAGMKSAWAHAFLKRSSASAA